MKASLSATFLAISASLLLANNPDTGHGESSAETPPSSASEGSTPTCANVTPTVPLDSCKECDEVVSCPPQTDTSPQNEKESSDGNSTHPYSGNAVRNVTDFNVAGTRNLNFTRFSATRLSNRNLGGGAFGREGSWSHNYDWTLRDTAPSRMTVSFPDGAEVTFKPTGTPNLWEPTLPFQTASLWQAGPTSWSLTFGEDGSRILFERRFDLSGGAFYRIESITDDIGNVTAISYNDINDNLIRQVTDATGRWIKLHYNDMGTASQVGDVLHTRLINSSQANQWHEVNLTPGKDYRFLAYYQGNTYRQSAKLLIAELEFYDENNVKITGGTPYGSTPVEHSYHGPEKAFDGDTATSYRYFYLKGGYVGLDLGAGNKRKVSKIRFHIKSPINNNADITFVGQNNEAVPNWVISHIEGSDGREVQYSYDVMTDASGLFQWARLIGVDYQDNTAASYTYTQTHDYNMPSLYTANDPRYTDPVKFVRYQFNGNTVVGFVTKETNQANGATIAEVKWGANEHTPKLVYPNGRVKKTVFSEGRMTKQTDSYGYSNAYIHSTNGTGHLLSMKDKLNRVTTYTRGFKGRLIAITYPGGKSISWTRDNFNRPLTVNENGRVTTHTYDTLGRRTRTDHPDSTFETWNYNTYGQPLSHRLRNGASESWTYDASGLKKTHTDAVGAVTTYRHFGDPGILTDFGPGSFGVANVAGRLAAMVDAHGNTTSYRYNDRGQVTRETRTPGNSLITFAGQTVQDGTGDFTVTTDNTYDDYGNLIARAVNTLPLTTARIWLYDYDSLGRMIRSEDPLGRETFISYDLGAGGCGGCGTSAKPVQITHPDGTITRNAYDKEWRLISTTVAFGTLQAAITSYTYDAAGQRRSMTDPLGHITRWGYDAAGRVTSETRAHGTPIASTTGYSYDVHGNRLTVTDPVGAITRSTYDVMNRPLTVTRAWGSPTDATTMTYRYEAATGRLEEMEDNIDRVTEFDHDNLDRVVKTQYPDGNFTQTFFDLLGRNYRNRDILGNFPSRIFDSEGRTITSTDAAGVTTEAFYNGHGDLTETSLPSGKSVKYAHDNLGNVIKTTLAPGTAEQTDISEILTRDGMLRPLTVEDGEGKITTYTYDPLGRTLTIKDGLNNITTYTYNLDGQLLTTKAADHLIVSTRTYDALHRLKTERDGKNQTITYNYDAAGRMTSYINARQPVGATFSFRYDLLGRQTRRTEPDFTFQEYDYDAAGRLESHRKADGTIIEYHYDNPLRNELSRTTYNGGTPDRSYDYTTFGQLHIASNAHSTVTFGYDAAGRKSSETHALAGLPGLHTFAYDYDTDGNLETHTRPDGSVVDYGYDLRNLLKDITADTIPPVVEYKYNGRNQLRETKVENGLFTAARGYDDAGRLTSVTNGALDSVDYGILSPDGRRTQANRNGQLELYGYDAARQVESASIPLTGGTRINGYQYDAAANRSSATTNGVTTSYFANAVNEYTNIGSFNPSHDPNGNLLTGQIPGSAGLQSASFSWNIHNELITATAANGHTATYQYDALGRRTKRTETIGGVPISTWFLSNGWNVELEYENGAYARRMTWGQDLSQTLQGAGGVGGLVMTEELPSGGGAPVPHFPTYDGNGNITAWVNAAGTVTARQRYDAFGNIIEQTGTPPSRYGFSTKPIELVTGFLYYGYRYYDPVTGRWPSRDLIGERGGVNLYGFVRNRALSLIDILGLDWVEYTGEKINLYSGELGDKSNLKKSCPSTSGMPGAQSKDDTSKPDEGPIPEGDYSVDLRPDPERVAQHNNGSMIPGYGIEQIPPSTAPVRDEGEGEDYGGEWGEAPTYDFAPWGSWRARLISKKGTDTKKRTSFYLHNSHKGYTHGCIETCDDLLEEMKRLRKDGQEALDVRVSYQDKTTKGGTFSPPVSPAPVPPAPVPPAPPE